MVMASTIKNHPQYEEIARQVAEGKRPLAQIARNFGVSPDAVTRFKNGNGKGAIPPTPLAFGRKIEEFKAAPLPWTYHLIADFYGVGKKQVVQAHRVFQRDRDERNGVEDRRRKIELLGQQIVQLRTERQQLALSGSLEEHREITARCTEVERELDRQEAAQGEHERREAEARRKTPKQRRVELEQGLASLQTDIDKHRREGEDLLSQAVTTFRRMQSHAGLWSATLRALNCLDGPTRASRVPVPKTFESFVKEFMMKGETHV